jgi:hypothetical protein
MTSRTRCNLDGWHCGPKHESWEISGSDDVRLELGAAGRFHQVPHWARRSCRHILQIISTDLRRSQPGGAAEILWTCSSQALMILLFRCHCPQSPEDGKSQKARSEQFGRAFRVSGADRSKGMARPARNLYPAWGWVRSISAGMISGPMIAVAPFFPKLPVSALS